MAFKRSAVRSRLSPPHEALKHLCFKAFFMPATLGDLAQLFPTRILTRITFVHIRQNRQRYDLQFDEKSGGVFEPPNAAEKRAMASCRMGSCT